MDKVVITQEMLEDAKTCGSHKCGSCKMYNAFKRDAFKLYVSCQEAIATTLDEERKLHGDIIAGAPKWADYYRVIYYTKNNSCAGDNGNKYYLPRKTPEDIIIEKHGEHAREILDEYKKLLDADK